MHRLHSQKTRYLIQRSYYCLVYIQVGLKDVQPVTLGGSDYLHVE